MFVFLGLDYLDPRRSDQERNGDQRADGESPGQSIKEKFIHRRAIRADPVCDCPGGSIRIAVYMPLISQSGYPDRTRKAIASMFDKRYLENSFLMTWVARLFFDR